MQFKLANRIKLRKEDFGGLGFIPSSGELIQLNQAAYKLLKKLINTRKIQALPEELTFWQEIATKGLIKEVVSDG